MGYLCCGDKTATANLEVYQGANGFDFENRKNPSATRVCRLVKRLPHINAADNTADFESDALWAEFDALEGALI